MNSQRSICLCLPSAGIKGVRYHRPVNKGLFDPSVCPLNLEALAFLWDELLYLGLSTQTLPRQWLLQNCDVTLGACLPMREDKAHRHKSINRARRTQRQPLLQQFLPTEPYPAPKLLPPDLRNPGDIRLNMEIWKAKLKKARRDSHMTPSPTPG